MDAGRRSVHESEDEEDVYTTRRVSIRYSGTRTTRQSPDIHFRLSLSKVQHANFYARIRQMATSSSVGTVAAQIFLENGCTAEPLDQRVPALTARAQHASLWERVIPIMLHHVDKCGPYSQYSLLWHPCALCSPPSISRKIIRDEGYFLTIAGSGQWDAFFRHDRPLLVWCVLSELPDTWQCTIP